MILIFRFMPPKGIVSLSKVAGTMAFYLVKKYRDRVLSNLSLALKKKKILRRLRSLPRRFSSTSP
jgi:lauroyl/myristoyl acyltransferase